MAYDFPASPTVGQTFSPSGGPVYTWDGEKWTTVGGAIGGKKPVYSDGTQAMEAQLTVINPPVAATDAAAKAYVDAADAGMVKYTAQTPTAAQQVQARQNLYAAPFDAEAYNGMQVNGGLDVSQERGTTAYAASGYQHAQECWHTQVVLAGAGGPIYPADTSGPLAGMNNLAINMTTGAAVSTSGDVIRAINVIEGYRAARLSWGTSSAQPITIGFWIFTTGGSGTISVAIGNTMVATRSYVADVAIAGGSLWQYKTVTIAGDITGTWNKTNDIGLFISFCFCAGSDGVGVAGWQNGNKFATASTTNFFASANLVRIAGLVVLPGSEAPSAARSPLIMRPYDQELLTCQRYYWKFFPQSASVPIGAGIIYSSTVALIPVRFAVRMRSNGTFSYSALTDWTVLTAAVNSSPSAMIIDGPGFDGCDINPTVAGYTAGQGCTLRTLNANGWIAFDARL